MTDSDSSDQESPGTTTRRQFVGAAASLAALPGLEAVDTSEGETLGFSAEDKRVATRDIKFRQDTYISHAYGEFRVSDYSNPEVAHPKVYARSDTDSGTVKIEPVGRDPEAGVKVATYMEFEPEDAEFFAAVLLELAQKARDEEEWRYP